MFLQHILLLFMVSNVLFRTIDALTIFKDLVTGDEMFTSVYKRELKNDCLWEVYGKYEEGDSVDIDDSGIAGLQFRLQDPETRMGDKVVDIVRDNRLQEAPGFASKKKFFVYLKSNLLKVVNFMEENGMADQVGDFRRNIIATYNEILDRLDELRFFTGESMASDGMLAILEKRVVDGEERSVMMFIKQGLIEEVL